jgi:hypothetical protein
MLADGKPVGTILAFILALVAIAVTALPPRAGWTRVVVGAAFYVAAGALFLYVLPVPVAVTLIILLILIVIVTIAFRYGRRSAMRGRPAPSGLPTAFPSTESTMRATDSQAPDWVPKYRAYRGPKPQPGNDRGSAHIGDYETMDAAIEACREYAGQGGGPFWVEPIEFNGDVHAPVYRNLGAIERVDVSHCRSERAGWIAEIEQVDFGPDGFLMFSLRSTDGQTIDNPTCTVTGSDVTLTASDERSVFHGGGRFTKSDEQFLFPEHFGPRPSGGIPMGDYEATWTGIADVEDGRFMAVERPILARCAFKIGPGKRLE